MRIIRNLDDAAIAIRDLEDRLAKPGITNAKGNRITNLAPSINPTDAVIRSELVAYNEMDTGLQEQITKLNTLVKMLEDRLKVVEDAMP